MIRLLCAFWLVCCGVAWGHLPQASHPAYYHADGAGNVTALMDAQEGIAARYLYSPFGRLTGKWGPMSEANRYRFSSKEVHAPSGLSYYGFRFYDASLQRWLNPDPLGEAGGINLFGFVRNDPLSFVDPYGEDFHVVGASGMQMPWPLGFLTGDTAVENMAAGVYNLLPQAGNTVANVGMGAVEAVAGLLGFADFASEQTGATRVLGRSPSEALEAINPALLSELQLLKWPKTAKPCAGKSRLTSTVGDLRAAGLRDAHHVIQDAAVRDLPGYNTQLAPGVQLPGPSTAVGTPHHIATQVQRQAGGGTLAAEMRIGYKALRQAGYSEAQARQIIGEADLYFRSIGATPATPTRIPGNR